MRGWPLVCVAAVWSAGLAVLGGRAESPSVYVWNLPQNFPPPRVPAGNPMSEAKAALGRHLFYDTRLSGNGSQACASCRKQELAFTDGRARAIGSTGEVHPRGSMSLVNVGYGATPTWANPSMTRLEDQALVPMFGEHPIELGLQQPGTALLATLRADARYRCHNGFTFSGAVDFEGRRDGTVEFHNTGLYNLSGALSYPPPNTGIYEVTQRPEDVGKFKAPTLRNIAVTAPYMHDGSAATLEDVVAHYAAGGRTIADGPFTGIGHDNPHKSPAVRGFTLTAAQRADLIAFLRSLTDEPLLHDPRWSNPWTSGPSAH